MEVLKESIVNKTAALEELKSLQTEKAQTRVVSRKVRQTYKQRNPNKFLFLTRSLILKGAELHPTNGWKTHRVKDLAPALKGMEFDYETLIADLKTKYGETIFTEDKNPMVGLA